MPQEPQWPATNIFFYIRIDLQNKQHTVEYNSLWGNLIQETE